MPAGDDRPAGRRVLARVEDLSSSAQIRRAALRLFAEHGARATSLRSIAAEANVSLGAVEHHFPTKAALEQAVATDVLGIIHDAIPTVERDVPVLDALQVRRRAWTTLVTEHPEIRNYVRRALLDADGEGRAAARLIIKEERDQLTALVEHGLARRPADFDATVVVYLSMVSAAIFLGPVLEELGMDVRRPADLERLQRAEIDILTNPLFPTDLATRSDQEPRGRDEPPAGVVDGDENGLRFTRRPRRRRGTR
jgi:TetR/AcrR family transcriptional regulator, regulator of cefoperazone and chloramphenicol sensitivity